MTVPSEPPLKPVPSVAAGGQSTAVGVDQFEIVVVSYHSRDDVTGLLGAAVPEQRIVIVDNASGVDGVADVLRPFVHGRYLDGGDSGFAVAANKGARSSSADYLVFANPDSRPTAAVWQALVAELVADPKLAVAAAATADACGRIEHGVGGWEPTLRRCLVQAAGLNTVLPNSGVYARPRAGAQVPLGWMTGACLAVRRSTFLDLGGFDERYFVYNEDMAFGRKVREAGLRQILRTDLLVPHSAGSSGGGSVRMPQQRGASMAAYLNDHNGALRAAAMRAALGAGILARAAVARAKGRRELSAKHLAYVRGISTGRSPFRPAP